MRHIPNGERERTREGGRESGEEERNNKLIVAKREMDFGTSEASFAALYVSQSVARSIISTAPRARLPEGREDHGAVVQEDPEAAEAARDGRVLLEPQ